MAGRRSGRAARGPGAEGSERAAPPDAHDRDCRGLASVPERGRAAALAHFPPPRGPPRPRPATAPGSARRGLRYTHARPMAGDPTGGTEYEVQDRRVRRVSAKRGSRSRRAPEGPLSKYRAYEGRPDRRRRRRRIPASDPAQVHAPRDSHLRHESGINRVPHERLFRGRRSRSARAGRAHPASSAPHDRDRHSRNGRARRWRSTRSRFSARRGLPPSCESGKTASSGSRR